LITPVLPISQIAETGAESPIISLTSSETTLLPTEVSPAGTTEAPEDSDQDLYQATVNGEFTESTHTFLSTTITTTPVTTIATVHFSSAIIGTTVTSASNRSQKHGISHGVFAIPKINSNHKTLIPALLHFDIDDSDDNDDNGDHFTFFWSTTKSFQTQIPVISSSEIKNLKTVSPVKIDIFHWNDSITKSPFNSLIFQKENGPNEDKFKNFTTSVNNHLLVSKFQNNISKHDYGNYFNRYSGYYYHPDNVPRYNHSSPNGKLKYSGYTNNNQSYLQNPNINPESQNYTKCKTDYYNCPNTTAISTFSASPSPRILQASASPPLSNMVTKIVQISSTLSQQPNHNYFEDLWSDIAGPPAVIIDSGQKESRNKTTRITSPTVIKTVNNNLSTRPPTQPIVTKIMSSNLSTRPLTSTTSHALQPTYQTLPVHKEAKTPGSDKTLTSTTPSISKSVTSTMPKKASFLLNVSVIDNGKEGKKGIERPEAKNSGDIHTQHKSQRVLIVPTVSSTFKHHIRTTLASNTIYAVRPTAPMGELITDTVK
uniref:SEA domain-containing protein n=1 Tax=Onchocerca flexuosa TaxID=387005 RepID=A0A183I6X7_9BILA